MKNALLFGFVHLIIRTFPSDRFAFDRAVFESRAAEDRSSQFTVSRDGQCVTVDHFANVPITAPMSERRHAVKFSVSNAPAAGADVMLKIAGGEGPRHQFSPLDKVKTGDVVESIIDFEKKTWTVTIGDTTLPPQDLKEEITASSLKFVMNVRDSMVVGAPAEYITFEMMK